MFHAMPRALHVAEPIHALRGVDLRFFQWKPQNETQAVRLVPFYPVKKITQEGDLGSGQCDRPTALAGFMLGEELPHLSREALMCRLRRQINLHTVPSP